MRRNIFLLLISCMVCLAILDGNKAYAKKNKEVIKGNVLKEYSGNDKCYTVPKNVKKISKRAFAKAEKLQKVIISENVKEIDFSAFCGAKNVSKIYMDKKNRYYDSYKGVLYSEKLKELMIVPEGIKKLVPPRKCRRISDECFENISLPKLVSLTIGAKWELMGEYTWNTSDKLKEIKVQKGNKVFYVDNGSLFRKNADGTVTLILYCSKESNPVDEYAIPSNVTYIAEQAFSGAKIKKIILPDSIIKVSMGAFSGCNVECVQIDNKNQKGNTFWAPYMFYGCPNLKKVIFTQDDTIIPDINKNIFLNDVVIYSGANSTAKTYADTYGYKWYELQTQ